MRRAYGEAISKKAARANRRLTTDHSDGHGWRIFTTDELRWTRMKFLGRKRPPSLRFGVARPAAKPQARRAVDGRRWTPSSNFWPLEFGIWRFSLLLETCDLELED